MQPVGRCCANVGHRAGIEQELREIIVTQFEAIVQRQTAVRLRALRSAPRSIRSRKTSILFSAIARWSNFMVSGSLGLTFCSGFALALTSSGCAFRIVRIVSVSPECTALMVAARNH